MGFPYIPTGFPAEVSGWVSDISCPDCLAPTRGSAARAHPREIEVPRFSGDSAGKIPANPARAGSVVRAGRHAFARTTEQRLSQFLAKEAPPENRSGEISFVRVRLRPEIEFFLLVDPGSRPELGSALAETTRLGSLPGALGFSAARIKQFEFVVSSVS